MCKFFDEVELPQLKLANLGRPRLVTTPRFFE
jgi:hypothetical protein